MGRIKREPDGLDELVKDLRTEADLRSLTLELKRRFFEEALKAELDDHLGYEPHAVEGRGTGNSRNGYGAKTLKTEAGDIVIGTPRDRDGTFEPVLVKKRQRRLEGVDEKIRRMYAMGMSTREIGRMVEELYGIEVSAGLVSRVTEAVLEDIREWQSRPLDEVYALVYLDCIVMKSREEGRVENRSGYVAMGVNLEGHKEVLGLWIERTEGARFWLSVLTELKARGVKEILIACMDGLTGFPEAVAVEYPRARIQLCIVHMLRSTMKYVSHKDRKGVAAGLRRVYKSASEQSALGELERFEKEWEEMYPRLTDRWRSEWENLNTIFAFPEEIRRAIYTTNAIESLNSVIRQAFNKRKVFPTDEAAMKTVYLVIEDVSRRWTKPIPNWNAALNRFRIEFGDQLAPYLS